VEWLRYRALHLRSSPPHRGIRRRNHPPRAGSVPRHPRRTVRDGPQRPVVRPHHPLGVLLVYEEYADDPDIETYRYGELSPAGQELFDRTLNDPDRTFEPTVCKDFLLVCDAYPESELPPEFTYGTQL
jgi:hypothetical protein